MRNQLKANPFFQLKEIFNHMDYDLNGFIDKNDFKKFLCTHAVFKPVDLDLESLVRRIDSKRRGKINFGDFMEEFAPKLPNSY